VVTDPIYTKTNFAIYAGLNGKNTNFEQLNFSNEPKKIPKPAAANIHQKLLKKNKENQTLRNP